MSDDILTIEIRGRRYTITELREIWRSKNHAGEGFADDGLRADDTPLWQEERDDHPSVIQRGRDVLLISSEGWAVTL